jgi:hypothetical protein
MGFLDLWFDPELKKRKQHMVFPTAQAVRDTDRRWFQIRSHKITSVATHQYQTAFEHLKSGAK